MCLLADTWVRESPIKSLRAGLLCQLEAGARSSKMAIAGLTQSRWQTTSLELAPTRTQEHGWDNVKIAFLFLTTKELNTSHK